MKKLSPVVIIEYQIISIEYTIDSHLSQFIWLYNRKFQKKNFFVKRHPVTADILFYNIGTFT